MQLPLVFAVALLLQGTPDVRPTDALALLSTVSQKYAQATAYHIEAVEERTSSNELFRSWQKTFLTAIVSPGGRYRYEGHSGYGWAIRVSDGTTNWDYHVNEHLYTKTAATASDPKKRRVISQEESEAYRAEHLVQQIGTLSKRLKSATLLPDEKIAVKDRSIDCYVVRFSDADFKAKMPDYKTEEAVWIDKARMVIVKRVSHSNSVMFGGSNARIPIVSEDTTIYPVAETDQQQPASSFAFSPPADAELVESFPSPIHRMADVRASEFLGKPAPEVEIKSSDGKVTRLSSFRGKPVFVEFWATWCAPCVELVPELKKLYSETTAKGLVWISIDNDQDPDAATKFLAQERISWPNYHDSNGTLGKAFGREGIPLGVLIDADGKITFYETGYEIAELRAAVAKLAPEFGAIAPVKSK